MKRFSLLFFLIIYTIQGCSDQPKSESSVEKQPPIEGIWKRLGTIQIVNGIPVDTLLTENSNDTLFAQTKILEYGHSIFVINTPAPDELAWKGGMSGFGKYEMKDANILTEKMQSGTGWFAGSIDYYKDSLGVEARNFDLLVDIQENNYTQSTVTAPDGMGKQMVVNDFHEYWERMPDAAEKTKIDGLWKRVYEISYVNGIAVDTVSVPDDAVLDVKILTKGHFIYSVDQTGIYEPDQAEYGGLGGYGKFKYAKGNLTEYTEFVSGNNFFPERIRDPYSEAAVAYHSVEFYNNDLFLQVAKDTLNQLNIGRGLVYERIKTK